MHNDKWDYISKDEDTGTLLKLKLSKLQAISQDEVIICMFAIHRFVR